MRKYQLNLFEPHIKMILEALQRNEIDSRLVDFIVVQTKLQDLSRESDQLQRAYDKHLSSYESKQQGAQH